MNSNTKKRNPELFCGWFQDQRIIFHLEYNPLMIFREKSNE